MVILNPLHKLLFQDNQFSLISWHTYNSRQVIYGASQCGLQKFTASLQTYGYTQTLNHIIVFHI